CTSRLHEADGLSKRPGTVTSWITSLRWNAVVRIHLPTCSGRRCRKQKLRTDQKETAGANESRTKLMNGTFNGLRLENVIALKITGMTSGTTRNTLRVLGKPRLELEQHFVLRSRASVKVSFHEIQGRIVRYNREATTLHHRGE